jgi:hypothetical protein
VANIQQIAAAEDEGWVRNFPARKALILARSFDNDYDEWQNVQDPLVYRLAGRSTEGLPLVSNGLKAPNWQMIVDTSGNPGRRVLRDGYVEVVGHHMWLGQDFFARVGISRTLVMSKLPARELDEGTIAVVLAGTPFVDETSATVQNRARESLFSS